MLGFRFLLMLDFGAGTGARARHGFGCRDCAQRRREETRRGVASQPAALQLPEELGWGPLEPEHFGRGSRKPKLSPGAWR